MDLLKQMEENVKLFPRKFMFCKKLQKYPLAAENQRNGEDLGLRIDDLGLKIEDLGLKSCYKTIERRPW